MDKFDKIFQDYVPSLDISSSQRAFNDSLHRRGFSIFFRNFGYHSLILLVFYLYLLISISVSINITIF